MRDRKHGNNGRRMQTVIIVIHLMVVAAMIGVVLLQKSEGGGLGIGSTGGFLSSRGTANVLTRTTAILATIFFLSSLALTYFASTRGASRDLMQQGVMQKQPEAPSKSAEVPKTESTPTQPAGVPAQDSGSKAGEVPK